MGKPTGFMDYERQSRPERDPKKRTADWDVYTSPLEEQELKDQPMHQMHVVQSLIHMHCNRLLGADHEKEKKALSFAQSLVNKMKHVKSSLLVN